MEHGGRTADVIEEHRQGMATARRLVQESRTARNEIRAEVQATRQLLANSLTLLRSMPGTTTPQSPPEQGDVLLLDGQKAEPGAAEAPRNFAAVTELAALVEDVAAHDAAMLDELIQLIRSLLSHQTDGSLLMGILLEGIVQAFRQLAPEHEQADTAAALLTMLHGRLRAVCGRLP